MEKYIRFTYSTGYCGTNAESYGIFNADTPEDEIADIALQLCEQHLESYGIDPVIEEEESGVEFEYDYNYQEVKKEEVDFNNCDDYRV